MKKYNKSIYVVIILAMIFLFIGCRSDQKTLDPGKDSTEIDDATTDQEENGAIDNTISENSNIANSSKWGKIAWGENKWTKKIERE